jgi:uncharacterized damage-inducible protein DinB
MHPGIFDGFDGEWDHASRQLIALAEATPPETFAWRPGPGVYSTSEILMHIALANFWLLSATGRSLTPDLTDGMEKTVTSKPDVIQWMMRSFEAVKEAHLAESPSALERTVKLGKRDTTAESVYLRIILHTNEHMGQLVAYARMNGIAPPWSK